jgi:polyhydroxyalkanoate synthase
MTGGLALSAFTAAWLDWMTHLALSPARQMELQQKALGRAATTARLRCGRWAARPCRRPKALDGSAEKRFADPAWSQFPFNVLARAHQNTQALLKDSVRDVGGLDAYHAQLLDFAVRMMGDASSPANSLAPTPNCWR